MKLERSVAKKTIASAVSSAAAVCQRLNMRRLFVLSKGRPRIDLKTDRLVAQIRYKVLDVLIDGRTLRKEKRLGW